MDIQRMEDHMRGGWMFPHGSSETVTYDDLSVVWDKVELSYDGSNTTGP